MPSCVLFAVRSSGQAELPDLIKAYSGALPTRDTSADQANQYLIEKVVRWPTRAAPETQSDYRQKFRAGAKLDPRRLVLVEHVTPGRLGGNPAAPLVRGRVGALDKDPWRDVEPPQGPVEADFIRTVYLGESIGPFRLFEPVVAVIPWDVENGRLLNARSAGRSGYTRLAQWLDRVESLWARHGKGRTTFSQKLRFLSLA